MVRKPSIRDKLLKDLARERGTKRPLKADKTDPIGGIDGTNNSNSDSEDGDEQQQEYRLKRAKESKSSLLTLLPAPKNSSTFGPTVRLDKLLKMPERAENAELQAQQQQDDDDDDQDDYGSKVMRRTGDVGMIEMDVSRVMNDVTTSSGSSCAIRELTIERSKSTNVVLAQGKAKQKNQITYLAQLGKATELERKEQAAQSRMNKAAARSKYGW